MGQVAEVVLELENGTEFSVELGPQTTLLVVITSDDTATSEPIQPPGQYLQYTKPEGVGSMLNLRGWKYTKPEGVEVY